LSSAYAEGNYPGSPDGDNLSNGGITRECRRSAKHSVRGCIDRVEIASWAPHGRKPPLELAGFRLATDFLLTSRATMNGYARCRWYHSLTDTTKVCWYYQRRKGWLKPWKIMIAPDDNRGLTRDLLEQVLKYCRFWRFLTIEFAIDFAASTSVNSRFVRKHAMFGKSRPRAERRQK